MEMLFTPWLVAGTILPSRCWGRVWVPSIWGILGPQMSASSRPTLAPNWARARASPTETVDLPTPPLPLATAMTWATPGMGDFWGSRFLGTREENLISTSVTPGTAATAPRASVWIWAFRGQAGVVSTTVKLTLDPSTRRSSIMFRDTRSLCSSGSWTLPRAARTSSLETDFLSRLPNNDRFLLGPFGAGSHPTAPHGSTWGRVGGGGCLSAPAGIIVP